jgi:methylase of polypeptide subunit release factors
MRTDVERIAAEQAPIVASALGRIARRGGTEADFRREAAQVLADAAAEAGLALIPKDEYHVARGNVDSLYNRLVLEYKRPGLLRSSNKGPNLAAIEQVKGYILDVGVREHREAHRLAGVATDGFYFLFVRRVGEGWSEDEPLPVNRASTELFLRLLFSLSVGAALIPENLVTDFGPNSWRARTAVRAIYRAFVETHDRLVTNLFEQWRRFFSEATDYREWAERIQSKAEFRKFVSSLWTKEEIRHLDAARVFFVLHTYYALLIKLVASLAAARFAGESPSPLTVLAGKDGRELKAALAELERGGLFREYGIRNFLEGDFFGWYLAAWNEDIEEAVSALIVRLAEYDPGALELAPENARDLLKKLYHFLLPKDIRHDLGEYYTPDWLAERLIRQTLGEADLGDVSKRVLDPACGSGTFLLILIKHIKDRAARRRQPPRRTLELILSNVIGFDLNPLAVIAARTNYLIALGDLMKHAQGDVDIPIYQADSVLAPSQGSDLFEGDVYPLRTTVGTFRIPARFADRGRMDALANALDESVETGISEDAFVAQVSKSAKLEPEERKSVSTDLKALYSQLRGLHEQGVNGVWARIIKNAFAPLFIEPCHYIVGNPPWVNWEHLPDEYRRSTMPLWRHYALFPEREKALRTILGGAKYDFSSLMTYVSLDKYLRRGGKLGFVLTQTLFKTAGAAQGFRRFLLPDGTPCGPLVVEDMVDLKPFEGASNRTSVAVFSKGFQARYPVSYSYWTKRRVGRGSAIGFDTPYESVTRDLVTFRQWFAEPIDEQDPTSAWLTDRRQCIKAMRRICGRSPYVARKGLTCSANGAFWVQRIGSRPGGVAMIANVVERSKRPVPEVQAAVEEDLIYPLLRGKDVRAWVANPEISVVVTHKPGMKLKAIPEKEMQTMYPKTWGYLSGFRPVLESGGIYRRFFKKSDPFYSVFGIGDYSFSEYKVVWREVSNDLVCAVTGPFEGRPVIPDHTLTMLAAESEDEAHFVCSLLNSSPAKLVVRRYVALHPSPHVLENIRIPRFSERNDLHNRLVALSRDAHEAAHASASDAILSLEQEIDTCASEMWGLTPRELKDIELSLDEV